MTLVLSLALLFSSSSPALAAPQSTYWNYSFHSAEQRFAFATTSKKAFATQVPTKKKQVLATSTPQTTKPRMTPATTTPKTIPVATTSPATPTQCSTGWYVTGYFTPVESDYTGATQAVTVAGKSYTFNAAFLKTVKTEGWGKTTMGKYIGYYDNSWHFASSPLDAYDHPLSTSTVAVDPSLFKAGAKIQITSLPQGYSTKVFSATDIGTGVSGKHIDVYTGEGKAAEAMTYKITGTNNTVCKL